MPPSLRPGDPPNEPRRRTTNLRFRIELDDVAAALRAHHDVGSSAAALLDAGTPRAKLVGYVAAPRGNRYFDDARRGWGEETPHPSGNHRPPPRLGKPITPQVVLGNATTEGDCAILESKELSEEALDGVLWRCSRDSKTMGNRHRHAS